MNALARKNLIVGGLLLISIAVYGQTNATGQSEVPLITEDSASAINIPHIIQPGAKPLPTMMVNEFTVNKDTRLGTVLRALARLADVNIAFGDTVENLGPFRFRLNNATPWNEVLESILNVYHLTYEVRGEIITIMTLDDVNTMYEMERQKNEQLELALRRRKMDPLTLKVVHVKYVKVEKLIEPLTAVLRQNTTEEGEGSEIRGSVNADTDNNNIIFHAPQSEMGQLVDLLGQMDRQTRQIRIEATLVEVSSQFAYELGVNWAFQGQRNLDGSPIPGSLDTGSGTYTPLEVNKQSQIGPMQMDNEGNFTLPDSTYSTMKGLMNTSLGTIDYGIISKNFALGMNLQALEKDGKVKILSRPSLTTMDNQKAMIKSGSDIPFRTQDQYGNPVVEYKEAVLSLDVLPHIVDDKAIFMDVSITKDEPDFSQVVDGNPVVLKKKVESRMMVLDGQTAVIGGLTKNSNFDREGGIPILKDIPLLGRLFRNKSKQNDEEELMIFLTPRIIPHTAFDNSDFVENWMDEHYHEKEVLPSTDNTDKDLKGFVDEL